MEVVYATYYSNCNSQWVSCESKNQLKHFPHVESAIHEMKIESTTVEMFWNEKDNVFRTFIANIGPEKKKNCIKLKKQLKEKGFKG